MLPASADFESVCGSCLPSGPKETPEVLDEESSQSFSSMDEASPPKRARPAGAAEAALASKSYKLSARLPCGFLDGARARVESLLFL